MVDRLECPHCGYLMDAFDRECPRCRRSPAAPTEAQVSAEKRAAWEQEAVIWVASRAGVPPEKAQAALVVADWRTDVAVATLAGRPVTDAVRSVPSRLTIPCVACGNLVDRTAEVCPSCGRRFIPAFWGQCGVWSLVWVAVIVGAFSALTDDSGAGICAGMLFWPIAFPLGAITAALHRSWLISKRQST